MKHAVVNGALYGVGTAVAEVVLILIGFISLDEHRATGPIKGVRYIPAPNWLFIVLPILVGLVMFLWTWNKDIEAERKLNQNRRPDES